MTRWLVGLGLVVVAACHHATGSSALGGQQQYVLRVDQQLDRSSTVVPSDPPADSSFRAVDPVDAYSIAVDGDVVTITSLDGKNKIIGGHRDKEKSEAGEDHFTLESGVFAGGRLVLRGARGELTIYGSGVPIVSSDRGVLVRR